jgi:membrane-bound lytic murein transglycosylase D
MGLTVNGSVDERKHIVAATRAAARYLKKNNFYMQNWLHALLSYNMGMGGCRALVGDRDKGADRMEIDNDTHWYITKFLAHRIAFEDQIGQNPPPLALLEYSNAGGKTLQGIARELELEEDKLAYYNKWLDTRRVPEEKNYSVIVPAPMDRVEVLAARMNAPVPSAPTPVLVAKTSSALASADLSEQRRFPLLEKESGKGVKFYRINGKRGIMASAGDISAKLADQADVPLAKFLKYNDLDARTQLVPGQVYYLKRKRSKAKIHYHVATEGESLWQISQQHGVAMTALLRKNRMRRPEKLKHGQVVWLRYVRPSDTPVEYRNIPKPQAVSAQATKEAPKPGVKAESKAAETKSETKQVNRNMPASPAREQVAVTDKPAITEPAPGAGTPAGREETTGAAGINPRATMSPAPVKSEPATGTKTNDEPLIFLRTHEVTAGQTLFTLSKQYGVSVADLRRWNGLSDTDGIKPGLRLIVGEEPAGEAGDSAPPAVTTVASPAAAEGEVTEHTVKAGDTLFKLAKQYGVTVQQLMEWNGKTQASLSLGEKLKVRK